jgi:hypothetical protein
MTFRLTAAAACIFLCPLAVHAQDVKALGTFGSWVAATYQENGKQVCYMSGEPNRSEGSYRNRGKPTLLVTHRPGEKAYDIVSVVAGYEYQGDSDTTVNIAGKRFKLFTNGDRAWARDAQTDKTIVQAMVKAGSAAITGTSNRSNVTTDIFLLKGFAAAYKAIGDACKKPA